MIADYTPSLSFTPPQYRKDWSLILEASAVAQGCVGMHQWAAGGDADTRGRSLPVLAASVSVEELPRSDSPSGDATAGAPGRGRRWEPKHVRP